MYLSQYMPSLFSDLRNPLFCADGGCAGLLFVCKLLLLCTSADSGAPTARSLGWPDVPCGASALRPSLQGQNVQGLHMDSAAVEQVIDLRPYMNTSPTPIPETFSLDRAYRMFTQLGLRHLVVVDRHNHVKGIVTRKVRWTRALQPHASQAA